MRNRLEKPHFWGLRGRERLNRPLLARLATSWTKTGPKPCRDGPFGLQGGIEIGEVKWKFRFREPRSRPNPLEKTKGEVRNG